MNQGGSHQLMNNVTVVGMAQSVYTQIVLLVLKEKNVTYDLQETDIFSDRRVSKIARLNPFEKIPVLVHGDFDLYETCAITRYIDETFSGNALQPGNIKDRARMHQIIALLDAHAYLPMVWGLFVQLVALPEQGKSSDIDTIEQAIKQTSICLDAFASLMGENAYLANSQLSLADLHAFPMVYHLALTHQGAALLSGHPSIGNWLKRMSTRLSVQHIALTK